ncbi:hypothetical protein EDB83DRAFT_1755446 [Lactarius deliciosus]|nr:hypothetical protein EDB83DRAFT_1755446 [Lactarius deliciosus]
MVSHNKRERYHSNIRVAALRRLQPLTIPHLRSEHLDPRPERVRPLDLLPHHILQLPGRLKHRRSSARMPRRRPPSRHPHAHRAIRRQDAPALATAGRQTLPMLAPAYTRYASGGAWAGRRPAPSASCCPPRERVVREEPPRVWGVTTPAPRAESATPTRESQNACLAPPMPRSTCQQHSRSLVLRPGARCASPASSAVSR